VLRATAQPKDVIYLDALEGGQVQQVMAKRANMLARRPAGPGGSATPSWSWRFSTARAGGGIHPHSDLTKNSSRTPAYANEKARPDRVRHHAPAADGGAPDAPLAKGYTSRDLTNRSRRARPQQEAPAAQTSSNREQTRCGVARSRRSDELATLRRPEGHALKLDSLVVRAPVAGRLTDMDIKVGESAIAASAWPDWSPNRLQVRPR